MTSLRSLAGIGAPTEARFFQFAGGFGIAVGAVYWYVSYEVAGTVLLLAFGGASGLVGLALAVAARDPVAVARRDDVAAPPPGSSARGARRPARQDPRPEEAPPQVISEVMADHEHEGRPYLDESGRIPSPTLAPFAVGIGVSIAATSLVFGPAPLLAGFVPFLWGVLAWLHRARSEFDATAAEDAARIG